MVVGHSYEIQTLESRHLLHAHRATRAVSAVGAGVFLKQRSFPWQGGPYVKPGGRDTLGGVGLSVDSGHPDLQVVIPRSIRRRQRYPYRHRSQVERWKCLHKGNRDSASVTACRPFQLDRSSPECATVDDFGIENHLITGTGVHLPGNPYLHGSPVNPSELQPERYGYILSGYTLRPDAVCPRRMHPEAVASGVSAPDHRHR